jgi:outer membrane cobalamin receptor
MSKLRRHKTQDTRRKTVLYLAFCVLRLSLCCVFPLAIPLLAIGAEDDNQSDGSDVIHLDEIIVSATRTPASLDSVSVSSSIVPEKQIRSSTATDLGHVLGATNILSILDYGPGSVSMASMRGSSAEQVLVLVDGERINDSRSGGVDLGNVSVDHAKRIEVIRGGQSAMYGADAVGGIINIITRQPTRTTARAWSVLGSYDSASWGVEASKRVKAVSGLISFSQMDTEADFPFEDKYHRELVRENARYMKRSIFGKLRWDISTSAALKLSGDHYYSDRGVPGPIGQYSPEATERNKSNGLRADLDQSLGKGILYKLSVYRRDATLRYIDPQKPYPVDDTHKTDAMGTELQVHLLQNRFPLNFSNEGGCKGGLILGGSLRHEDVTSTAIGDRGRETHSGYVQQELGRDLGVNLLHLSRLAAFPALRWDHYSDFEAGVSPKLGLLASFGHDRIETAIKANIGRAYRAPTLNELYWPADAFASGNPDLKPERSRDADAGIYFRWMLDTGHSILEEEKDIGHPASSIQHRVLLPQLSEIRCGVSYFWNSFRNRIQWSPGAGGKWSPQNLSEARSAGLEAETWVQTSFWSTPDLLSLGARYTFVKAEDKLKRQLIYRPKHSLGYTLRVGTENLWGQIQGLYRSRRYYTVQNTKWLEPFIKHDFQIGVERRLWNTANVGIILEVRNILDTKYQLVADYPLPGREWSIKTSIGMEGE